ncbi:unnamed protein product [Blepharisma stoltei]|uniref:Uncharacterized protein n=1 Tax=Blepharisma stoltei TaxID=1481888 RepID=A0AAU9INT8_9CILI|nr:unnamed protein product [Blepharisma stoltei]
MEDRFALIQPKEPSSLLSFPKKRTYTELQAESKPIGPPPQTKATIQEEYSKLKLSIAGGQTLETYLSLEEQHLEIEDYKKHSQPEDPYQQATPDFILRKRIEINDTLRSRYRVSPNATMLSGILPEIHRVWYSLDNILILWDYTRPNSIIEHAGSNDVIVGVAILPKNTELFTNRVSYVLLVATRIDMQFIGVVTEPEFRLVSSEMNVTTDEVDMECFTTLNNGRILIGGADGNINELKYTTSSWFSSTKKYKKECISSSFLSLFIPGFLKRHINPNSVKQLSVDSSRNILYALIKSTVSIASYRIEVYDLGIYGDTTRKVVNINSNELFQRLREHSPRLANLSGERLEVVHISAISRALSLEYHLMALTRNGIRIYFTFHEALIEMEYYDEGYLRRPLDEYSINIKFPPASTYKRDEKINSQPFALGITSDKPSSYEIAQLIENGNLIISEKGEMEAKLVNIGRSLSRIALFQGEKGRYILEPDETVSCIEELSEVDVQCMAEIPASIRMSPNCAQLCNFLPRNEFRSTLPLKYLGCRSGDLSFQCLSNLSNILYRPPSKLLVLTSSELLEFSEIRPIDLVYQALIQDPPKDIQQIRDLSEKYGIVHVCAMLVAILSSPLILSAENGDIQTPLSSKEMQKAFNFFRQIGNNKIWDTYLHSYRPEDPLMALAEFKALYIHLGRILRPVWSENITYWEGDYSNQTEQFHSPQLKELKDRMIPFIKFIRDSYPESIGDVDKGNIKSSEASKDPIINIYQLSKRILDGIELLTLLSDDYSFRKVVNELTNDDQMVLQSITFRDLICTSQGHILAKALIEAYITQLRNPRISRAKKVQLEECLRNLNQKCSSFFTTADSEIYVAEECLSKAKSEMTEHKNEYIEEAMKRLLRNAASVGLQKIVGELKELEFYKGIIHLCLQKAKDIADIKGKESGSEVYDCYQYIFQILHEIQEAIDRSNVVSNSFASYPADFLAKLRSEIIDECCKVNDRQLHWALFTWFNDIGSPMDILSLESPFVKEFIEKTYNSNSAPDSPLLAKYCMKMKDFLTAFKEFGRIAILDKVDIPVELRMEYLDLSSLCLEKYIENFKGTPQETSKLKQEKDNLELRKDLARIQLNMIKEIGRKVNEVQSEVDRNALGTAYELLNRNFLTVSDLCENFAKKYELLDSQFELLHYVKENSNMENQDVINSMKSIYIPLIKSLADDNWPNKIISKLEEFGTKYPYAFNLSYIISKAEPINASKNIVNNWLPNLALQLPIEEGYAELWDYYYGFYKESKDDPQMCWTLLARLEFILKTWLRDLNKKAVERNLWSSSKGKDLAPNYKFDERAQSINEFFIQVNNDLQVLPESKRLKAENEFKNLLVSFDSLKKDTKGRPSESAPGSILRPSFRGRLNFSESRPQSETGSERRNAMG